jgi:hypothetical protein
MRPSRVALAVAVPLVPLVALVAGAAALQWSSTPRVHYPYAEMPYPSALTALPKGCVLYASSGAPVEGAGRTCLRGTSPLATAASFVVALNHRDWSDVAALDATPDDVGTREPALTTRSARRCAGTASTRRGPAPCTAP